MPAQIRPTRLDVSDRFPIVGFRIRVDDDPAQAELAVATDPTLFTPEGKGRRTRGNFYATGGNGAIRFSGREASYTLPPEVLARMIGNEKLYYGVATRDRSGAVRATVIPGEASPYVSIRQLTPRSMARVRLLPSRQQIAAGYGANGQANLEWAGDSATPGMQPVADTPAPAADSKPNGAAAPGPVHYDDGFGPMPAEAKPVAETPPAAAVPAPAPTGQALAVASVRALADDPVPVTPPSVTVLGTVARVAIEAGLNIATGPIGPLLIALKTAANALGCSVGFGPQVGAGLGAGGALGVGIIFGKDGDIGVYGAAEIDIGFITSISATGVVTIVQGGIEEFNGWSYALAINGGEGVVGGAAVLLNDKSEFVGCSANVGVGAGFSPVDFYVAAQHGWATKAMAQGLGVRAPVARAMVVGKDDMDDVRKYAVDYKDLFQWSPPPSLAAKINARGFKIQRLEDAVGDLNLDFYKVEISSFPAGWDAPKLLNYFIHNINAFADSDICEFKPYADVDAAQLASGGSLLGCAFNLDIKGKFFSVDPTGWDNAAIFISAEEAQYYAVTTINTPDTGDHPVSGHRQFGYYVVDGLTTFYTRGADRATLGFPGTEGMIFSGGESLWESFQRGVSSFITSKGGSARIVPPFSKRFNPSAVRLQLGGFEQAQAQSLGAQAWTINWDDVELIPQPTDFTCWAAAGAMVVGWRDMVSLSPETVAGICGRSTREGLATDDNAAFAAEMGLSTAPAACYTVEGFRDLLANNGPLWVSEGIPPNLHAIVVTGMYSDGSATFVRIADPWDRVVGTPGAPGDYPDTHATGSRYIMTWEDFTGRYEAAMTGDPPNRQILHAGGTGNHVANTGASIPVGYAQAFRAVPARRKPVGRTLSAESFTVNWDDVQQVAQPTDVSCWATAAAMVLGWRDRMSLTVEGIAAVGGRSTATGLDPAEVGQFAADLGLVAAPPQSYTVDAFRDLVTRNGPLWVGAAVPGLHAIVVTGVYGDGDDAYVRITDPWDRAVGAPGAPGAYADSHATGSRYIMRWADFVAEYEKAATDFSRVNLQILHCGDTFGNTPNTGQQTPPGYAMAADDSPAPATATDIVMPAPPPPRARAMDAGVGEAAIAIGGFLLESVRDSVGDITWELDQFRERKHPNDVAPASPAPYKDAPTIKLDQWPVSGGLVDDISAWFAIDWQYNGSSLGNVRISNIGTNDAVGWGLHVRAQIMDDNILYAPNSCAALKIRLHYRFNRSVGADTIAITDVHLYGDGTHEIASQWVQSELLGAGAPARALEEGGGKAGLVLKVAEIVAGEVIKSGGVTWQLDKFDGPKFPNDLQPPKSAPFRDAIPTTIGHQSRGWVDKIGADFQVDWQYNGTAVSNIRIKNIWANDAILAGLDVRATIAHDNIVYDHSATPMDTMSDGSVAFLIPAFAGADDPSKRQPCAAMRILFDMTWDEQFSGTSKIQVEIHLFGDGLYSQITREVQ